MDDLKAKQDYLYREIIEQNYDPELFQEFMEQKKGLALQLYTLQELIDIVQIFKKGEQPTEPEKEESFIVHKDPQGKEGEEKEKMFEEDLREMQEEVIRNKLKDSSNTSTKLFRQFLKKQVVSSLYTKIFKKSQKVEVKIRSYCKKEQQSIFGSTYISYVIETPECSWSVQRRYKDFQWLQQHLLNLLPGYPIPPIPKKTTMRSFQDKHLEERKNTFQQYLNKLIIIPQICSFEIVDEFLRVQSRTQFDSIKLKAEQTLKSRGNKIQTLKGSETINMEEFRIEHQEYQFYKKTKELTHNLNNLISSLQKALKQASQKAFELSSCFNELFHHTNLRTEISGSAVYDLMNDFANELGYKLQGQYRYVHSYLENYWNYEERYLDNLVGCMSKVNKDQYELLNKYKNIGSYDVDVEQNASKGIDNKLFAQYQQARELYRLKLSLLKEEVCRYSKNDLNNLSRNWVLGLRGYIETVKNLILSGADQLTKALCVSEGKKLVQVEYISKKVNEQQLAQGVRR